MTELLSSVRCNGVMGVPITFLDKYTPEQFKILGITLGNTVEIYIKDEPGGTVYYAADNVDGYLLSTCPRILIRRRSGNEN